MRNKWSLLALSLLAACAQDPPQITAISPNRGPTGGGTTISVSGINFEATSIVFFDGIPCTQNAFVSSGGLTAVTPPSPGGFVGGVMVTVRNKDGQRDHFKNGFTYTNGPGAVALSTITPNTGAAGTNVTISGGGFQVNATVQFGGNAATNVVVQGAGQLTCAVPPGSGSVTVTITNTDGSTVSVPGGFTYNGSGGGTKTITTFAGTGSPNFGGDNGPAASAQLNVPQQVATDSAGALYIADTGNNRLRKVTPPNNTITTLTGNAGELNQPRGVAVDSQGNVYISDTGNQVVKKLVGTTLTVYAGTVGSAGPNGDNGPATSAQLSTPLGLAVDATQNLFIADSQNHRIRRVAVSGGTITTFAGTGTAGAGSEAVVATLCALNTPSGVLIDTQGNVFIADTGNARVRKVTGGVGGTIATFAGGGSTNPGDGGLATSAVLMQPVALAQDANGGIAIADQQANVVRIVNGTTISLLAGNYTAGSAGDNGSATAAQLAGPRGVAVGTGNAYFVGDSNNSKVRKVQ